MSGGVHRWTIDGRAGGRDSSLRRAVRCWWSPGAAAGPLRRCWKWPGRRRERCWKRPCRMRRRPWPLAGSRAPEQVVRTAHRPGHGDGALIHARAYLAGSKGRAGRPGLHRQPGDRPAQARRPSNCLSPLQTGASTCRVVACAGQGSRSRQEEEAARHRSAAQRGRRGREMQSGMHASSRSKVSGLASRRCDAPLGWRQLLAGEIHCGRHPRASRFEPSITAGRAIFPGAFNPLHEGHRHMAEFAAARLGVPVEFELSITNVDKPPLDFLEMADRAGQFIGTPLWFTSADTFVEKIPPLSRARRSSWGSTRSSALPNRRYYGGETAQRDAAVAEIAERGCRFLVFGRPRIRRLLFAGALRLPAAPCPRISGEIPAGRIPPAIFPRRSPAAGRSGCRLTTWSKSA